MGIETATMHTTLSRNFTIQTLGYVYREVKRREGRIGDTGTLGIIYTVRSQMKQNIRSCKQM